MSIDRNEMHLLILLRRILKAWDLRAKYPKRTKPKPIYSSEDITLESAGRARGIVSVVLDERGEWAWAMATDGSIYTYPVLSLSLSDSSSSSSLSFFAPALPVLSHPNLKTASFYVRLAVSPCGRYLASGSTSGEVYTWAVDDHQGGSMEPPLPVELIGHEKGKEVGSLDWGYNMVCYDLYFALCVAPVSPHSFLCPYTLSFPC